MSSIVVAAKEVAAALIEEKYAVVGGAACVLLGSDRATQDVDVVVPKGKAVAARNKFRESENITVELKTAHTHFGDIEIELLTPPMLFQQPFDESTPTIDVQGVKVLKPALILNAKCQSVLGRSSDDKKLTDADDIQFLLQLLIDTDTRPAATEVAAASKEFVVWFTEKFGGKELWEKSGYNMEIGSF